MIKALAHTASGPLIVVGITDANVERMQEHDPIVFNAKELGLSPRWIAITAKDEEGNAAVPELENVLAFALSSRELRRIEKIPVDVSVEGMGRFVIFRGKDESTISGWMRGMIGPATQTRDTRPITQRGPNLN